jgi:hypothetical protein
VVGVVFAGVVFVLLLAAGAAGVAIGRTISRVPAPNPRLQQGSAVRVLERRPVFDWRLDDELGGDR